jgi:hypothetical protein
LDARVLFPGDAVMISHSLRPPADARSREEYLHVFSFSPLHEILKIMLARR